MKIDLRKTKAKTITSIADGNIVYDKDKKKFLSDIKLDPKVAVNLVFRLLALFIGILILLYFEQRNIGQLIHKKNQLNKELNSLTVSIKDLAGDNTFTKLITEQASAFKNKFTVIQQVAKSRLLPISSLDQIQNAIPVEVWLNKIDFRKNKIHLNGISYNNKDIQVFVENLEQINLFSLIHLKSVHNGVDNQKVFIITGKFK